MQQYFINKKTSVGSIEELDKEIDDLEDSLDDILKDGDAVLIKASHGMHFEKIVEQLKK